MKVTPEQFGRIFGWSVVAGGVFLVVAFLAIAQPGGSGILGSVKTPDGSEYVVEQRCNWSVEPYTVSFYMRSPNGDWGWCYIDHEAPRWKDVQITFDEVANEIVVTEQGVRRASLNRGNSTFWFNNGSYSREVDAPQGEGVPTFANR